MDINEGMAFGCALIPYSIMSGIQPVGNRNGFELYYEGGKVASGKMLPDDMERLREMIEIHSKYKNVIQTLN